MTASTKDLLHLPVAVPLDLSKWRKDEGRIDSWHINVGNVGVNYFESVAPDGTFVGCHISLGTWEPPDILRTVSCSRGDLGRGGQSLEECRRDVFSVAERVGMLLLPPDEARLERTIATLRHWFDCTDAWARTAAPRVLAAIDGAPPEEGRRR